MAVCVCLLLSAHRAVIFAIGQLSCYDMLEDRQTDRHAHTVLAILCILAGEKCTIVDNLSRNPRAVETRK